MDFVAIMVFTQQVFHLCLFFLLTSFAARDYYFESNHSLVLLMKVFVTKKACIVVLLSSKHEEMTFPREFIFVFIQYLIGAISSEKILSKVGGSEKS